MIILVSGATTTLSIVKDPRFGHLFVPRAKTYDGPLPLWAADNSAFTTLGFDDELFIRLLDRTYQRPHCIFVTAPDIVGNSEQTLEQFFIWERTIRFYKLPVALVAQNGLHARDIPWHLLQAVFIGGSPECPLCKFVRPNDQLSLRTCPTCNVALVEWKLRRQAATIAAYAAARGKWVHMGRVNSERRLRYAASIGCNSIDGTAFSKWPDHFILKGVHWLDWLEQCPPNPPVWQDDQV